MRKSTAQDVIKCIIKLLGLKMTLVGYCRPNVGVPVQLLQNFSGNFPLSQLRECVSGNMGCQVLGDASLGLDPLLQEGINSLGGYSRSALHRILIRQVGIPQIW
jgi:hypothetical protein